MSERWVGIAVSGDKVTVVDAIVPEEGPLELQSDQTFRLQRGERAEGYHVVHRQVSEYLSQQKVDKVIVKASATSKAMGKGHLEAAELRGVVMAAAASVTSCGSLAMATISRHYGERKAAEYLSDDEFWQEKVTGCRLRGGSREAAMILIAARK